MNTSLNRFHILVILAWQFMIMFATQMLFGIFTTYTPRWRCTESQNGSSGISSLFSKDCSVHEKCPTDLIEFEPSPFASAAIDFEWICGTGAYTKALYSQLQFIGVLLGTVVLAPLSDSFGRKPVGLSTFALGLLFLALSALSPNWQWLLLGRFAVSFLMGGSLVVVATFTMEIMPPEHRMILRTFCNWGISRMLLTLLCFLFPDWRTASVASALASAPGLLIIAFFLPESPIWLHSRNRLDQMHRSEKRIARLAGREYVPVQRALVSSKKSNFWTLVRDRTLFARLLVLWMMWFTSSMSSYSVDLNSSNISGDLFLNQWLLSIPIIVSKMLLLILDSYMPGFSRRTLHHLSQLVVVLSFIFLTVLILFKYDANPAVHLILVQLGTVFIQFTWDACFLSGTELMPTPVRTSGLASCSLVAQLGALVAPLLVFLNEHWAASTYLAVVLLGSANLFVSWMWLVDTKGIDLDAVKLNEDDTDEKSDCREEEEGAALEKKKSWTQTAKMNGTAFAAGRESEKFLTP